MGRGHSDREIVLEQALKAGRLGLWDWNIPAGQCFYSDTWAEMLGYAPGELSNDPDLWLQFVHPEDRERAIASGERHIRGEIGHIETELRLRHKKGHWVWVLDRGCIVERDEKGKPVRLLGVQTDISQLKTAEKDLERLNERLRLALTAAEIGIWHFDTEKSYWDQRTKRIFGFDEPGSHVPVERWHTYLHPEDKEKAGLSHQALLHRRENLHMRYRIIRADGCVRHVETLARYTTYPHPTGSIIGTVRDVTEEVLASEAIETEKERLRVTLQSITDAVISTDVAGCITFVNPAAGAIFDKEETELVGCRLDEVFPDLADIGEEPGQSSIETVNFTSAHDAVLTFRCKTSPIHTASGASAGWVHTLHDITEEKEREKQLVYAAHYDALTGLLNRAAFESLLAEKITRAEQQPFALLYIDLDYFKALNDRAGHAMGDEALKMVAAAIRNSLPDTASAARLGGDEFAAILPNGEAVAVQAAASTILEAIRNTSTRFRTGLGQLGASIGIAIIVESRWSPGDVLAYADDACYAAKSAGRNQYKLHSADPKELSAKLTSAKIIADIEDALEEDRLQLFGQEIRLIDDAWRSSGRIEVLCRLMGRDGKLLAPSHFLPAAERFGRAARLDRWIIKTVLTRYAHKLQPDSQITLGFNLSAQTLSDPLLWSFVDASIEEAGVSHQHIVFEITETTAVTNFAAAEQFVRSARERGCLVSLDDFGSGMSSFEYLRSFPVDSIKITGSFVQRAAHSQFDRHIVSSISKIAHGLGYNIVAEQIENRETLSFLSELGVKFGQGFLLHRPEPLAGILQRYDAAYSPIKDKVRSF